MNIINKIEQEEKKSYMTRISDYVADVIAINYKHFKNKHTITFDMFYNQAFDTFKFTENELQQFYDMIEDSLEHNYSLIRINDGYDKPLVLKKLDEEE